MRKINLLIVFMLAVGFTSCSSDDTPTLQAVQTKTVANLHAPQQGFGDGSGEFTKFSFTTGQKTTSATDWDIAFRGRTILVNGGAKSGMTDEPNRNGNAAAYVATGTMASITNIDISKLKQDDNSNGLAIKTGSNNGWYIYTGRPLHKIRPIAGKILVFRTRDGKYAKVQMKSYYKDNDESKNSRYLTFDYVYNPNQGATNF